MKALQLRTPHLAWAAAMLAVGGPLASGAAAQINTGGNFRDNRYIQTPESRVLLLTTLRNPDRPLAVRATTDLATQIRARIQAKEVYLIPHASVVQLLEGSSFPADTALSAHDARLVGRQLRADEYLDARVETAADGRGYKMSGRLYLMVDPFINDEIPDVPVGGTAFRHASDALIEGLKQVRKQIPHFIECSARYNEGKHAEAEAAARKGISEYPDGTIARVCLMRAIAGQRKGADALLEVAREVLQRDSLNRHALAYAVDAYMEKADTANYVTHAARLMSVDITNATLVLNLVNVLAQMHRADVAIPYVERAIAASPLDAQLVDLSVLLYISAERWKDAARRSEEFLRLDPEAADSAFFVRMAVAYRNDSQPDRSADALRRAAEKFPANAGLQLLYGQELNRAGKTEEAIAAFKRAIEADPNYPGVRTFIASAYQQMNQPDSTLAWLRRAHEAKENAETIGGMALTIGNNYYRAANESKTLEAFEKAIPALAFADSVNPTNPGKWLFAVSDFNIAQKLVEQQQASPTCQIAQRGKVHIERLQTLIRGGGGQVDPATAGQIMTASVTQYLPYIEQQIAQLCTTTQ